MRRIDISPRRSLSNILKAIALIVVIFIAVVAVYYLTAKPTATTTTQVSTIVPQNVLVMELQPENVLIAPGLNESYTSLEIVPISPLGNETLLLSGTSDPGLGISLSKTSIPFDFSTTASIPIMLAASSELNPGSYQIAIQIQTASASYSQNFTIEVVKTLVVMQHEAFSPQNITVSAGSTVVWMNIDTEIGCCDPGFHTVTFVPSSSNISSPVLHRFDTWSHEFSSAGDYRYYCTIHPNMLGEVIVTS